MIVALIIIAVLVVALGVVLVRRRARRPASLAAPRAPMPEVLVTRAQERPTLVDTSLGTLAQRLSSSRGVFDRVRSITNVGALSVDQLDVVEEVLLRSDVGVTTTRALLDQLRENGAPQGVAAAVRDALLASLQGNRSVSVTADPGRVPVWLFVGVNGVGKTTTIGKLAQR
ncbi:MAG: signal recognition particle receptor subunit alpha, partial [Acidimicrobiales bacterium]